MLPNILLITGRQLAAESIVTSSASVLLLLNVFKIPHRYWSISNPSNNADLLQENSEKTLVSVHDGNVQLVTYLQIGHFQLPRSQFI